MVKMQYIFQNPFLAHFILIKAIFRLLQLTNISWGEKVFSNSVSFKSIFQRQKEKEENFWILDGMLIYKSKEWAIVYHLHKLNILVSEE